MKNYVKQYRIQKRLTQRELANMIGVDTQTVANIEKSRNMPRPYNARKLAEIFGVTVEQLFDESSTDDDKTAA